MKTILILYENNGAGHRRSAKILESMLAGRQDCRAIAIAGSELFSDPGVELINRMWIFLVRKDMLTIADWLMNFHLRAWILPLIEIVQLASYHAKLDELSPDAIVCTADGYGKTLGLYAQERSIPLFMVNTEFSMFADLANPFATHICYFPETINAVRSYRFDEAYFSLKLDRHSSARHKLTYIARVYEQHLRAGGARSIYRNIDRVHEEHNKARCVAVGPLVEPVYYEPKDKLGVRRRLGIDPDKPCALIISGSIGGDYLLEITDRLLAGWQEPLTLLAVSGKDARTLRKLQARAPHSATIEVRAMGFVDNMDELYAAADVVIARPSASVLLEAMMRRVPILIPQRATANDLGGAELLKKHALGEVYRDSGDLLPALRKVLAQHQRYVDAIHRFLSPYPTRYSELQASLVAIILSEGALDRRATTSGSPDERPSPQREAWRS